MYTCSSLALLHSVYAYEYVVTLLCGEHSLYYCGPVQCAAVNAQHTPTHVLCEVFSVFATSHARCTAHIDVYSNNEGARSFARLFYCYWRETNCMLALLLLSPVLPVLLSLALLVYM
jgi:hypothetical protein